MRLPKYFKIKISTVGTTKKILKEYSLYTVCEEARCPNKSYCFSMPTATFLILGDTCTRSCAYCSVKSGIPKEVDLSEPYRIVSAAKKIGLKYIVITSVTRDDLKDGGASHFAKTIRVIKNYLPDVKIEVLTPDFKGDIKALRLVLNESPTVFNHNIETVKRLYPLLKPQADYLRSLKILTEASKFGSLIKVKSGLMVGLGETIDEIVETMSELVKSGCKILTIGQYLRPSKRNISVKKYLKMEEFEELKNIALSLGFEYVLSGPLVRSSMNAKETYKLLDEKML
ncbi:MAG: lipoyl synthase [Thermodesulfovibrionales bacterium]|nr:lipoyl synthase [Thermodesulfovibrionales bacterium]